MAADEEILRVLDAYFSAARGTGGFKRDRVRIYHNAPERFRD